MQGNPNESKQPDQALARVMADYMPYIQKRASRLQAAGLEPDDLVQEGLVGLFRAIQTYSEQGGASFSTYALTCIDNSMRTALKQANRKKNQPLSGYLPLGEENGPELAALPASSPEERAIAAEDYAGLVQKIHQELSLLERNVLALYLKGYDYAAVAKRLDTTPKSVDNALQRARKKLKNVQ